MNQKSKLTLEDLAASQKLALEYTAELPPQLPGMLDGRPDPTRPTSLSTIPSLYMNNVFASALRLEGTIFPATGLCARPGITRRSIEGGTITTCVCGCEGRDVGSTGISTNRSKVSFSP
jgi:hypothetical protein